MFEAVLFDLDGTLADTAPDLGAALNRLRVEEGLPALPLPTLRPYTSQGVRGLLRAGFGIDPQGTDYSRLSQRFLELYAADLCVDTRLFDGIAELLADLRERGIPWGIVTNKRTRYTDPLVSALGLRSQTTCVVSGDTTAAAKPSPLPILHACGILGKPPGRSLYVGDDRRDIEAGRAAGTATAAAAYGYLGDSGPPESWDADFIADHPVAMRKFIFSGIPSKMPGGDDKRK